jgi:hypothetical protein
MANTIDDFKEEILDNIEQFKSAQYPEDLVREYAESWLPVYNHEIIEAWTQLPMEKSDVWKQYGFDEAFFEGGIIKMMSVDLYEHYLELYFDAFEQVKNETGWDAD